MFVSLLLSHCQGKWTQTGPCTDYYLLLFFFGWFAKHLKIAMAAATFHSSAAPDPVAGTTQEDWHAVAGVRYRRCQAMMTSAASRLALIVFVVAFEPLRILCSYFLYISYWVDRSSAPPLMDLIWEPFSIVHHVQQLYSALLRGDAPRIWIFKGMFPEATLEERMLLRRALRTATAAVYRRHVVYIRRWRFLGIGDARRPHAARFELGESFLRISRCCLRAGLWRRLATMVHEAAPDEKVVLLMKWAAAWFPEMAWLMKLSIADVERVHAKNRRRTHPQNAVQTLIGRHIAGELKNLSDARTRLAEEQQLAALPAPVDEDPDQLQLVQADSVLLRAQSPLMLFRSRCIKENVALAEVTGYHVNPCSKAFWDDVKMRFTEQSMEDTEQK